MMRFYDMDGNRLPDIHAAERLFLDHDARRVALTDFGDVARVSTVLLVIDHNWSPDGPPLIFETMTFMDGEGDRCKRTSTRDAALAAHDQACTMIRDTMARFDAEIGALGVN